ncbi:MAG: tetratricopeptide repeat protein [Bacteroidales bacterium]|nr:tetratricopeptide repeat protein [Bacteroidales bacterium]
MKMNNKHIYICIFIMLICLATNAQTDKGLIRHGNAEFKNGNFSEAEVNYRKSLDKEYSPKAQFNLGDALYEQKNYEDAQKNFSEVTERNVSKEIESDAYYNLGNTYMAQEKYAEAFDSYKKSLKSNPKNDDARYNLEYARWKMIQQQQQQQQQMSKEDAERMLKALENQEKETMEDINDKKAAQMQKRKSEKDW